MPRMTNAKSADTLNDADSFEDKLNWILFKQEQDARLWSSLDIDGSNYEPDDEFGVHHAASWRPGDPMYDEPVGRRRLVPDAGGFTVEYEGNHVRYMIEEIDINVFHAWDAVRGGGMNEGNAIVLRCGECETIWEGPEPCFVCGEVRQSTKARLKVDDWIDDCDCILCSMSRHRPPRRPPAVERSRNAAFRFYFGNDDFTDAISGDEVFQTVPPVEFDGDTPLSFFTPAGSPNDPLVAFDVETRGLAGRGFVGYSQEDIRMVMRMYPQMRNLFLDTMGQALRNTREQVTTFGAQVLRAFRENQVALPGELFVQREGSSSDAPAFSRLSIVTPRRAGRSAMLLSEAEWATRWPTEVRSNGLIIPLDYDVTSTTTPPTRDHIRFRYAMDTSMPRNIQYPNSAPDWSRRRPRYE